MSGNPLNRERVCILAIPRRDDESTEVIVKHSIFHILLLLGTMAGVTMLLFPLSGAQSAGDGAGIATLVPATAPAGATGHWTVDYLLPEGAMAAGGGVKIRFVSGFMPYALQTSDPAQPGFVSAETSAAGVDTRITIYPLETELDWQYMRKMPFVQVTTEGGALQAGDRLRVHFGNAGGGAFIAPWTAFVTPVLVASDVDGDGSYAELAVLPDMHIMPLDFAAIQLVAPSLVGAGTEVEATAVLLDELLNRVPAFEGRLVLSSTDPLADLPDVLDVAAADEGRKPFVVTFHTAGNHVIRAVTQDGRVAATSNPIRVTPETSPAGIFWGDIHSHSDISYDGVGNGSFVYARDTAVLDFFAATDHSSADLGIVQGITPAEWTATRQAVVDYTVPGEFVALLGYEFSAASPSGHYNVYYQGDEDADLLAAPLFYRLELKTVLNLWSALEDLPDGLEAMTIPHHSGITWRGGFPGWVSFDPPFVHPTLVPSLEIVSFHGQSERYAPDHPLSYESLDTGWSTNGRHFAQDAWAVGRRLGTVGGSDDHFSQPGNLGLTAVYAPELTRRAVFDAIRAGRTYATSQGQRIILDFSINGTPMGSDVKLAAAQDPLIRIMAVGTDTIAFVELLFWDTDASQFNADGHPIFKVISRWNVGEQAFERTLQDTAFKRSGIYYVRLKQVEPVRDAEVWAWSSPIWVERLSPGNYHAFLPLATR